MKYATVWQRFWAGWIDMFVFLPLMVVVFWTESLSRVAALLFVVPMAAVGNAYEIYCHGRYGQTIGKYAMGIRVVRINGERIGWREAWLRSSIQVAFSLFFVVSSMISLVAIPDAQYDGADWMERAQNLQALEPSWAAWIRRAGDIWIWIEFVVMLFNKQRRALHDFIAGTVVTSEQKIPDIQKHPTQPSDTTMSGAS